MFDVKRQLHDLCVRYAQNRIKTVEDAISSAREASENDTKSSAGDKFETSREMLQQDISRLQLQLVEAKKLVLSMSSINPDKLSASAVLGALIITDKGNFFLSISAGQMDVNGKKYFAISPLSPLGTKLKGLKPGEGFFLNQTEFRILEIF